jgi:hypothetical protein
MVIIHVMNRNSDGYPKVGDVDIDFNKAFKVSYMFNRLPGM